MNTAVTKHVRLGSERDIGSADWAPTANNICCDLLFMFSSSKNLLRLCRCCSSLPVLHLSLIRNRRTSHNLLRGGDARDHRAHSGNRKSVASHAFAFAVHSHHSHLTAPSLNHVSVLRCGFLRSHHHQPLLFLVWMRSPFGSLFIISPCDLSSASLAQSLPHVSQPPSSVSPAKVFFSGPAHARGLVTTSPQPFNHAPLRLFSTRCLVHQPPHPPGLPPASPSPLPPPQPPPEPHPLCLFAPGDIQVGWTPVNHSVLRGGLSAERR